ncbi:MAG: hypothetical protein R3F43_06330 [bacterium]
MLTRARTLGARCLKISKALGLGVPDPSRPDALLAVDDARLDPIWEVAGRPGHACLHPHGGSRAFSSLWGRRTSA